MCAKTKLQTNDIFPAKLFLFLKATRRINRSTIELLNSSFTFSFSWCYLLLFGVYCIHFNVHIYICVFVCMRARACICVCLCICVSYIFVFFCKNLFSFFCFVYSMMVFIICCNRLLLLFFLKKNHLPLFTVFYRIKLVLCK